ncbi:MAG: lipoprotein-releasing ABC transporter permease subunit [Gammaproteobacteria bacterium]|nr:lipoprotein-releasing ABC transporter permease subunit [Gammaproteobacteria bacterium]
MFKPLALFIGLRYTRAHKRNHFISFISLVSVMGIALGVAVLITVLSVMNGFDQQIKTRILSMVPQVTVSQWGGQLQDWQGLAAQIKGQPNIVGAAPVIQGQAMMSHGGMTAFGMLQGIDPTLENQVSPIGSKVTVGSLNDLVAGQYHIILGQDLASSLGVTIGDKVTVYVPKTTMSIAGILPRLKQFTVTGIFVTGYQYDSTYALVNIKDAGNLLIMGNNVSGLQLKLSDLFLAPQVVANLNNSLPSSYQTFSWIDENSNFFQALAMEKLMMFLILVLIIAVAAFNMLSSLVMMVTDKQSDIAILRTIGASSKTIIAIFMVQGSLTGLFGTLLGTFLGVVLSLNITALVNQIQNLFHVQFLNSSVYYINFLPSELVPSDVIHVSLVAFGLSLLATIYPAWRASKIKPAEALRYE